MTTLLLLWLLQAPAAAKKIDAQPCPSPMVESLYLQPIYPGSAAKEDRGGKVQLETLIASDGSVQRVEVLSGDPDLAKEAKASVEQWEFRPCMVADQPVAVSQAFEFEFHPRKWNVTMSPERPVVIDPSKPKPPSRVRVSGGVAAGNLRHKVMPRYPAEARAARIQGNVVLHVVIGGDGGLMLVEAKEGHPLLVEAALGAVLFWRYKPYFLNGEPVEVDTLITVRFTLGP
jgi:TonB family protein